MKNQKTYTRLWDRKTIVAHVVSMNKSKVTYTLNDSKIIHKEYTKLFLSAFN